MDINYNIKSNSFEINVEDNLDLTIIKFKNVPLAKIELGNLEDVFYYGYEFEDGVDSKLRAAFFELLRFNPQFKSDENRHQFIISALSRFNSEIPFSNFDCIVYPKSRSTLNKEIIHIIDKYYRIGGIVEFELIKQLPKNITFDFERYEEIVLNDSFVSNERQHIRYNEKQKKEAIEKVNKQLEMIHISNYFSIAESVQSNKLKPFFDKFLKFKTKKEEKIFQSLQNKDVLIIDDVTTTGATLIEIVKTLRSLNSTNRIVVFTIIGKKKLL